jgi:hypothetical protein
MKYYTKFLLLIVLTINTFCYSQDLNLVNGQSINISNNTTFYVNGLEINPSVNFEIIALNSLIRSSTAIDVNSINRVFNFDAVLNNFEGKVTLTYDESELNGIDENDLVIRIEDEFNTWNTYSGTLDTGANTIAYDVVSPLNFLAVTASSNITLTIENIVNSEIKVYPNPTINTVNISTPLNIEVTVFNANGQKVLQSQEKSISVSHLAAGLYIFEIKDISNNNTSSYKILKH